MAWRIVAGRRVAVVPVAAVVGWELALASERAGGPDEIVVIREIKTVQQGDVKVEIAVVADGAGKTKEIEITREDTPDNAKDLGGTILAEADTSSPAIESEIEEEQEVEE